MTDKKPDPTSDASRADPKTAEKAREDLKQDAERGLKEAVGKAQNDKAKTSKG